MNAAASVGLVQELLRDQAQLDTPAARFARQPSHEEPRTGIYRDLIPLGSPAQGEQYAFEVDLDKCTGCKACVAACHSLNGLEPGESWRDTGLLIGELSGRPFQQVITTACHHCLEPACAHGCPVLAYEKDESTGVVRHLDDQCIGCSYCVLKCPYDVPKYSKRLGIVRKCDMCHSRLTNGEAPACVQACPSGAIRIVRVEKETARQRSTEPLLPGAFDSGYTQPTTRYVGTRTHQARLAPADANLPRAEHTHWPLVVMLVLTQAAAGMVALMALLGHTNSLATALAAAVLGCAGLGASVLHLGRPLRAWRVFLGLRRSWLSREVIVFGLFAPLLITLPVSHIPGFWPQWLPKEFKELLAPAAAVAGLAGVFCSIMVYVDTRRPRWNALRTTWQFAVSTFGLGAIALGALAPDAPGWLAAAGAALLATKAAIELSELVGSSRTARLLRGAELPIVLARIGLVVGGLGLMGPNLAVAFFLFLAAELAERALFFRAVDAPRMPGVMT